MGCSCIQNEQIFYPKVARDNQPTTRRPLRWPSKGWTECWASSSKEHPGQKTINRHTPIKNKKKQKSYHKKYQYTYQPIELSSTTTGAMETVIIDVSLRDKINHKKTKRKSNVADINEQIFKMQQHWAGQVARQEQN